jgi:16S rRNA U516 pseudouridylate synthase RsuA-like enzyme
VTKLSENSFSIVLTQGYNRQIRRMCEHFDYRVRSLKRIRVMNVLLENHKPGEIWQIEGKELETLKEMVKQLPKHNNE